MAATIKQIALKTKLSVQTVSQCLRADGPKAHLYRPETRQLVVETAKAMGYRPNTMAKAMANGKFGCVALVLSIDPVRSTVFGGLLCGLHDELSRHDMQLTVSRLPDERLTDERQMPKILREWCCDGLLINYTDKIPSRLIEIVREYRLPAIWINSRQEADCVYPDEFDAGHRAATHLLALGHRRIAFADFSHGPDYASPHYSSVERRAGYDQALAAAGLPACHWVAEQGPQVPGRERVAFSIARLRAEERPTAVVCYSANDAIAVYTAATALGLQVPQDLSLIAFAEKTVHFLGPNLTIMRVPEEAMGRTAVELLLAKIARPGVDLPRRRLSLELEEGETCGIEAAAR